jgi:hypothetical protein
MAPDAIGSPRAGGADVGDEDLSQPDTAESEASPIVAVSPIHAGQRSFTPV